jgi:acyl-CoA synthetase (AMP-forming)/AMP-acid ligase II
LVSARGRSGEQVPFADPLATSTERLDFPPCDITSFVLDRAAERGDKPALIDGPTGRAITYAELERATRAFAAGLASRGLGRGDTVGIFMPNLPEYAVVFHGTARSGACATTVNPLYTARELAQQLRDAHAKVLLTVPAFLEVAHEAASQTGLEDVFVVGQAPDARPFTDLLADPADAPEAAIDPGGDLAALP